MQEVSKKSVNGGSQVSGGYIFDQMDRFAHDWLKKRYRIKSHLFTKDAIITYHRQVCNWDEIDIVVLNHFSYASCSYDIRVHAIGKKDKLLYVMANFGFVTKDHAYCDTKGE